MCFISFWFIPSPVSLQLYINAIYNTYIKDMCIHIYLLTHTHTHINIHIVSVCVYISNLSNLYSSSGFTKNSHLIFKITLGGRWGRIIVSSLRVPVCKAEAPGAHRSPRGQSPYHRSSLHGHTDWFHEHRLSSRAHIWTPKDPKPRGAWGNIYLRLHFTDWKTEAQSHCSIWCFCAN